MGDWIEALQVVGREWEGWIEALLVGREWKGLMVTLLVGKEWKGWIEALLVGREWAAKWLHCWLDGWTVPLLVGR